MNIGESAAYLNLCFFRIKSNVMLNLFSLLHCSNSSETILNINDCN